jgi:hypothetical protein
MIKIYLTEIVYEAYDWIRRVSGNGHAAEYCKRSNKASSFWISAPA